MEIDDIAVGFRSPIPNDIPLIFDSWVESFRMAHAAGPIPMDLYRGLYREIIRRLMNRRQVTATVAYNETCPDQELGYAVVECDQVPPVVHYVFVKQFIRRRRLGTALLNQAGVDPRRPFVFTFKSRIAGDVVRGCWTGGYFDPIVVRRSIAIHHGEERV